MTHTLSSCQALDWHDPLRHLRDQFDLPAGVIYLDGNSLGVLPKTTPARIAQVVQQEWGQDLIRSWNSADWFRMPQRIGDKIGQLVGAGPGETVATDSTSINLFKVMSLALTLQAQVPLERRVVLSERSNFPTDLYTAEALCRERGWTLQLVEAENLPSALKTQPGVVMLTHVNYRTGAMHDMATMTTAAHEAGAVMVWDLAHSAGAVPLNLNQANADFAVGCGYKYLNGGPGAPAFVWMNPRHAASLGPNLWQPLAGWWGHQAPFQFTPDYRPAPGIQRFLCGTQPIVSLAALECGVDSVLAAQPLGGMAALRAKSLALTDLFMDLVEQRCRGLGLKWVTPSTHAQRGSQLCLTLAADMPWPPHAAYAMVQALIARGVIGDFRAGNQHSGGLYPDILRFGFTPLYLRFEDVWNAVEHLRVVLTDREWERPEFAQQLAVT
jgi:kynureninase